MFESILADILNRYLKPYVKKLDTSQLRLGIWKGDVCLENLELKEDIFTDLGVPVIIRSSHIGKIILKIPWKNLTKESIIVTIEDVYVVAGPVADTVYDEKKEKERNWEKKQAKLKDIEETRKKQESQKEEKDTFVEKLITHIVKNLLVKVHSIHVRYEDTITNPGHPMAAGITLDSIEMQTTDASYKPCVIKESATLIYKLIQMDCLAFYWMVDAAPLANLDADIMKNKMKALITRKGQGSVGVKYVLRPLTAEARMKLNAKPNYHDYDSKVVVDVSNEVMELVFRRSQYCSLMDTMESLDRAFVQHRYHKYRDKLHSNENNRARVWWEYAITCVLEEQVKRKFKMWSWTNMKMTREKNRLYTEKYLDKITSFTTSSSLVKELEAMEQEMDLFAILLCRQQAVNQKKHKAIKKMAKKAVKEEAKAEKLLQKQQQQQKKQIEQQQQREQQLPSSAPPAEPEKKSTGFFSRLKNRLKHGDQPSSEEARKPQQQQQSQLSKGVTKPQVQPTAPVPTQPTAAVPAQPIATASTKETKKSAKEAEQENIAAEQLAIEREKLFEAIGYSEGGPKEEYPREYIAERVNLKLKLLALTLVDDRKSKKIGHIETTNITASVVHRPADNGVTIHGSVHAITVLGVAHESHDTTIVSTPETKEETGEPSPLIVIQFDVHPLGISSDFMLFASLNPLEIIYDSETIDSIINMFLIQKVIHFQELTAATMATVDQLQLQTRAGLEYVLKKRKLIDIKLSLKSPYIVIPTGGVYNSSASVVVVDLGGLEVTSSSKEFVGSAKNREVDDYYDTFNIKLSTVQVIVAKPGEDWRHARAKTDVTTSRLHILKPAGMELVIQRSILQKDALLPSLKVEGAFSSFEIFISDTRLKELMKVLLSIQIPPPSLKNATKFIEIDSDILSLMVTEKLENLDEVIDKDLDSLLSAADDQSQPRSATEVESEPLPSVTSQSASTVFTQLSLNVSIKQISLELSQEEGGELVKPLLHLQISEVMANVRERSWDSSAAISVKDIVIFDHITLDSSNAPVKLLEADTLSSGKVLSLDAVLLSNTNKELVAKLTNGESTINCNMSLLQLNIHENTMVELSRVAFLLAPLLLEIPKRQAERHPDSHTTVATLPTKPTSTPPTIVNLKVNAQACFKGLKITVSDAAGPFIITEILALQVAGLFSSSKKEITASMDGLAVTDLCGVSSCAQVISVSGGDKKMLEFKAMLTSLPSDDSDSGQSELELSLEVQQLKIYFIMQLFSRFLMMISHLHFDPTFVNTVKEQSLASRAKKEIKVTTTMSAPVGSSAAKIRAKLNLHFHAPIVTLPIVGSSTALKFDLGDFVLTTTDSRVITQPNGFKYVQETIRITSSGIRADRVSSDDSSSCEMLPVMKFDVNIVRSLLENPVDIPLVDVQLKLETVKVHLCSKEIVAFLLLVSSFDELTQIGKEISYSAVGSGRIKHNNVDILPVTADGSTSFSNVPTGNALLAKITAELDTLQLDVAPLCSAEIKSIKTVADVDDVKIKVSTSVETMTVFDLAKEDEKITSYFEKSKFFAELNVIIYRKAHEMIYSQDIPLPIKMDLDVKLSSFHLILNMGFISRTIEFGQTVVVDKKVLEKLARVAQDAASALPDELARYNIFVSAPVIYLSLPKATHGQALILNCGQMKLNNNYLKLEGEGKTETSTVKKPAYVNRYSFSLTQLAISRSIVAFYEESIKIKAQRTLLQPIQFTADISNSLSSNVTSVPSTCIKANLGNVKVSYGDEDVKSVVNYVATIIGNFKPKSDSEFVTKESLSVQTSFVDRIATDQQKKSTSATTTTATAAADVLALNAILESFTINTYTSEPPLSPKLSTATIPSSNALMIINVRDLSVSGSIEAGGHKVVGAELGDIEIIDAREKSHDKMTRKLLQSFKGDPTKASSVETSGPIIKVKLNSSAESGEDYVNIEGREILVLLDVDFILCVQAYANSIYQNILNPEANELVHDALESLKISRQKSDKVTFELAEPSGMVEQKRRGFKLQGIVEKFAVALLDPEQSVEQVVILQTNMFSNLSMDISKGQTQLSLRLDGLTMTSSHLLKLDSPTSHFLLPALVNVVFSMNTKGTTKLDLWVDVDCITLSISPAIISLLFDVVSALVPKKKEAVKEDEQLPPDIWNKHELSTTAWYLMPVMLKRARGPAENSVDTPERNEVVVVEVKRFEINISRGHGPVNAELALNGNVYLEANDITSALQARATLRMEASYYNDHHSLWEPLIEPLEDVNGKHVLWTGKVTVKRNLSDDDIDSMRASVTSLSSLSSLADSSARYKAKLSADNPLQVTLSKKSLSLIKDTVEVYSANVSRDAVTHKKPTHEFSTSTSAFTIKNKLGPGIVVCIRPGDTLKFVQEQKLVRCGYGEMVDLAYVYAQDGYSRESKSVLLRQPKKKEVKHCIDIEIETYDRLKGISLVTPGLFYYTVIRRNSKTSAIDKASVVVEIIFSDTKKSVFIRPPLQVQNHTDLSIDMIISSVQQPHVILANTYHPIPLDKMNEPISFKPTGKGLDTSVMLHWMSRESLSVVKCISDNEPTQRAYYLKVVKEVEDYANSDVVTIDDDNPHHVIHIYPPAVLCNLLPVSVTVMNEVVSEGKDITLLQLNPQELEPLKITLNDGHQNVHGIFPVFDDMEEFTRFNVGEGRQVMELSVHREDLSYHKLSLYASYWMVNKTDLTLEYKDFESKKRTIHNSGQEIMCYACDHHNQKGKVQISAKLGDSRHTEWSAVISLNAAGTRGCARLKCGNVIHDLGIKIKLSRFTLTKVVTISPYYLVINDTQHYIKCVMGDSSIVEVSSKNVKALWPKTTDPFMHIIVQGYTSRNFQYRTLSNNKDNIVENVLLKMDQNVVAIVVEFNITQNSHMITFSPYYSGSMPARIVNACDNFSIRIRQNTASAKDQLVLGPHETAMYTWDDPAGTRLLWWSVIGNMEKCTTPISLSKNSNGSFKLPSGFRAATNIAQIKDTSWTVVEGESDDGFTEIVPEASLTASSSSTLTMSMISSGMGGYWISFLDHLQRVVMFTQDRDMVECAKAGEETGLPILDFSASLKNIGVSLVNNSKKKEIAYIGITQSSVIWEVKKKKNKWITLNNEIISILEEEYTKNPKATNIEKGKLHADLSIMQIHSPYKGQLRRTYYDGLSVHFKLNEKQIELGAKLGHMQVDNQLPFSVYPQVLYPLPPPPTVASTCEPKPFIEASVIIRRSDKVSMAHIQYAGLLIQEMAVNVDIGFLLSIISFFTLRNSQSRLGGYVVPQKKEALLPLKDFSSSTGKDITVSRYFFTLIHFSPIKIRLSFNIRSYGKNLDPEEDTVAKQALNLLLHSLGVVLTSVQETEMKYAFLHLEYQQVTLKKLKNVVVKHYSTQTLYQIYSLIFGLDMLGNPVSVVKGVAGGAIDLFYEPYKGVVLGGDEFLQGLGIGLKSFLGGTVGGIAGAGAKVTGAVGDVFAKLTFDEEFIDRRQQQKAAPPKLGSKLGGFAKNLFQGVTGVVTQPVKGAKQEGVLGLAKGMGKGVVGLVMRPTGGLIDLASGSLDTVRRGTSLNNVEVFQMRAPRFIDREGTLTPYSAKKAQGNALLLELENGEYASTDCYITHMKISSNPLCVLLITDMRILVVQKSKILEMLGWSINWEIIHNKVKGIQCNGNILEAVYKSRRSAFDKLQSKYSERYQMPSKEVAKEAVDLINTTVEYNK